MDEVAAEVVRFKAEAAAIGLRLNHTKCEAIGLSPQGLTSWSSSGLSFVQCETANASLLGAPLHVQCLDKAIEEKCEALERTLARLKHMSAHEAIYILRNSLSVPRLQYILRCAPSFMSSLTTKFDDLVLQALSSCTNIEMDCCVLPVRWGGLGLRSAAHLAHPHFCRLSPPQSP